MIWSERQSYSEIRKTMSIHRLCVIAPDLYAALGKASEAQLNVITLSCCRFAISETDLTNLIVAEVLRELERGKAVSRTAVDEMKRLADWLDDNYLRQQEAEGYQSEDFFRKVRAASSVWFASQAVSSFAFEVVCEVIAATNNLERVSRLVREVIVKEK